MRAVSPGRAAVRDMAADHSRLCVAMAGILPGRVDIVAPPSGCVVDKGPLRIDRHQDFASWQSLEALRKSRRWV